GRCVGIGSGSGRDAIDSRLVVRRAADGRQRVRGCCDRARGNFDRSGLVAGVASGAVGPGEGIADGLKVGEERQAKSVSSSEGAMGVRRYFRRRDEDAELAREIEGHVAHETDENVARGIDPVEARRRALVKFGSTQNVREDVWEWNTIEVLDGLWRDFRYVVRTLRRAPGFAVAVIVVMALGIGAVTAMYTIVRSVLLKPLPFAEPQRLVMLYERSADGKFPFNSVAGGAYLAWQREAGNFEQLAAWQQEGYNLSASNGQLPEMIVGAPVSWNFFVTLGVQP